MSTYKYWIISIDKWSFYSMHYLKWSCKVHTVAMTFEIPKICSLLGVVVRLSQHLVVPSYKTAKNIGNHSWTLLFCIYYIRTSHETNQWYLSIIKIKAWRQLLLFMHVRWKYIGEKSFIGTFFYAQASVHTRTPYSNKEFGVRNRTKHISFSQSNSV